MASGFHVGLRNAFLTRREPLRDPGLSLVRFALLTRAFVTRWDSAGWEEGVGVSRRPAGCLGAMGEAWVWRGHSKRHGSSSFVWDAVFPVPYLSKGLGLSVFSSCPSVGLVVAERWPQGPQCKPIDVRRPQGPQCNSYPGAIPSLTAGGGGGLVTRS